jgi:hypothetical protein
LQCVLIPGSVAAIGDEAFSDCRLLSEVTFGQPSKLTTIGAFAFLCGKSLQRLHIVASVLVIGHAFVDRSGVREITVESGNAHFRIVEALLIGGDSVVLYFGFGREVVVPSHVTVLGNQSFSRREALEAVSFEGGSQLRSIGREAFCFCRSLLSIRLPASLEVIAEEAFSACSSLLELTFEAPSKLRVIANGAFARCGALTSITLPGSLRELHEASFAWCGSLKSVTFEPGSEPPEIHPRAFLQCENLDEIYPREYADSLSLDKEDL